MTFMARTLGYGGGSPIANYMWSAAITPTIASPALNTYFSNNTATTIRTPSGDFVIGGTVQYGTSGYGKYYYVYKIDGKTGAKLWSKKITPTSVNFFSIDMCADSAGNVFVTFSTTYSIAIQKLDANTGASVTSASFDLPSTSGLWNSAPRIISDSSGNVYSCVSAVIPYTNGITTILRKYDNSLNFVWQKTYGSNVANGSVATTDIDIDASNNIYIAANCAPAGGFSAYQAVLKLDSSGSLVSAVTINTGIASTNDFYMALSGNYVYLNTGKKIVVLNTSLNYVDAYELGGSGIYYSIITPGATVGNVLITSIGESSNIYVSAITELDPSRTVSKFYSYSGTLAAYSSDYTGAGNKSPAAIRSTSNEYLIPLIYQRSGVNGYNGSNSFFLVPVSSANVSLSEANASAAYNAAGTAPTRTSISVTVASYTPASPSYSTTAGTMSWSVATDTTFTYSYNTYNYLNNKQSYSYILPGTYTWYPAGVSKVSFVLVGGGAGGSYCIGGGGGGLSYKSNYTVPNPCGSYTVTVGAGGAGGQFSGSNGGATSISSTSVSANGGTGLSGGAGGTGAATGGSYGGNSASGGGGGGGAGGYTGAGGNGGSSGGFGSASTGGGGGGGKGGCTYSNCCCYGRSSGSNGGGVGIVIAGNNGLGGCCYYGIGFGGSGGTRACYTGYGAGGGSGGYNITTCCTTYYYGCSGKPGAVRIIWPGCSRSFPSTNTKDMTP